VITASPSSPSELSRWTTDVPGWAWNVRPAPYEGPAAGYAAVLDLAPAELVFVRHRVVLGAGACRFASRVVVPRRVADAFPAVAANPYRRLLPLAGVLASSGCRPTVSTSSHRAIVSADLAALFTVEVGSTCHRTTLTLRSPRTHRVLALGDHLSGWTTLHPTRPAARRPAGRPTGKDIDLR